MRLLSLTALTMAAFAANSVLNRLALADGDAGPAAFAALRLVAGAAILSVLVLSRGSGWSALAPKSPTGVWSLALYMLGFSFAYVTLDAGVGALILFGGVQLTMFAGALLSGERIVAARWIGTGLALAGLAYLLWPSGAAAPGLWGALLMAAAAVGWGIYSLHGRTAFDPLGATAGNFVCAVPLGLIVFLAVPDGMSLRGAVLAILSGAVTSGLGYALWYRVLPQLAASTAALVQLTVPVIALAGGMAFLGEALTLRFVFASALILGGVAIGIVAPQRRIGSSGS
ncbi:MAG: DMT family transporter [Pseudomonadota bacterium]